MANLILNGSTSGSVTLSSPAVSGTTVLTLPVQTGTVMVNGPAFSAYATSTQTISGGAFTKVTLGLEDFDTNNNFASSTFTPTVAGYYQINCTVFVEATTITRIIANIYKNGASLERLVDIGVTGSNSAGVTGSMVVYMNGSTDYLELYIYATGTGTFNLNGATDRNCRFNGSMVRGA